MKLLLLILAALCFLTTQAHDDCNLSTLSRKQCGYGSIRSKEECVKRGCCFDYKERHPARRCYQKGEPLSLDFRATYSPALFFGGEPGYPGWIIRRGCPSFLESWSCRKDVKVVDKYQCYRFGCCWDSGKCFKSIYNIIRVRERCAPGFSDPGRCEVTKCEHDPCGPLEVCEDQPDGFRCAAACPNPNTLIDGTFSATTSGPPFSAGTTLTYTCNVIGHQIFGSSTSTCQTVGPALEWVPPNAIGCGLPPGSVPNPCASFPCLNGGTCLNKDGTNFECVCTQFATGPTCSMLPIG